MDSRISFLKKIFLMKGRWVYCACQQKQRFGPSRCESSRTRDATSKNNENLPENRPKIVENCVSGPLGRPPGSTFVTRSESVERLGATRGDSSDSASDSERPSRSKWVGRGRSVGQVARPLPNPNAVIRIEIEVDFLLPGGLDIATSPYPPRPPLPPRRVS